ncbi:MAG: type III pantothenate kinase [Armatimonadetes bacterium]|nr:type III pantothenate kinase [Armatimonadota bacterium]MDW8121342.1 type III pantothenate kinase [Armatimonadota bacterium]
MRAVILLACDAGNTNITVGLFDTKQWSPAPASGHLFPRLIGSWRVQTDLHRTADETFGILLPLFYWYNIAITDVGAVVLCSVVPPVTTSLSEMARRFFKSEPLIVTGDLELDIVNAYEPPQAVGADRLVNAIAARHLYGLPAIVVDFGTATTFDAISAQGVYLGGAIAPGITLAADLLFQRTAQLPRVALTIPSRPIGRNTMESIQSGLLLGYGGLVKEIVGLFIKELGPDTKVIATGGLAPLMAPLIGPLTDVNTEMTLQGLGIIWAQKNRIR